MIRQVTLLSIFYSGQATERNHPCHSDFHCDLRIPLHFIMYNISIIKWACHSINMDCIDINMLNIYI